ncbi:MAG: glycoside hydrolase family 127 protein [Armatimonadota bacterium]|nr:glycoside hydrolase family 127 protein [Armatimonadota bacterium]
MKNLPDQAPDETPAEPITSGVTRRRLLKTAAAGALTLALPATGAALQAKKRQPAAPLPPLPQDKLKPVVPNKAVPFDLGDVRLLPGPFRDAQERDGGYLLFLEPDRLLHNFHVNAGLPPKAPIYGGWESAGVAGHIGGHYLSACSMMYRSTGDARFRQRVDYMVGELAKCQAKAPDGLVTAIPDARTIFAKIAADGTVTGWVPWYTMHKLYAGLRDAYTLCGNAQARHIFLWLTDWAIATTQNLTDAQFQHMLDTEQGGMAETTADAYAMTGNPKYRTLAQRFTHHAVFDPLAARQDNLNGQHSNTNIPKMIGYERIYELTGDKPYHQAPLFFWQTVVHNRSYANGGNGDFEHFFPVTDFHNHIQSDSATETCCTYNMLKLTRSQFVKDPSAAYADYYERALLNHILASQEHSKGLMIYHTPMKPGHFKVYDDPVNAFWCCTGTGIENHSKYTDSIYFHGADGHSLYVNLFIPSTLTWHEKGLTMRQDTRYPEGDTARLTVTCAKPTPMALKLRFPAWAKTLSVTVNGKAVSVTTTPGSYLTVDRTWHSGDVVQIHLPMAIRTEALPHTPDKQAVFYGPTLLVGALGTQGMDKLPDVSTNQAPYNNRPALEVATFVAKPGELKNYIKPVAGHPLTFHTQDLGQPNDVTLVPMYQLNHQRLNFYWSVLTPDEYAQRKAEQAKEDAQQRALDARTVDQFLPGNQQSEVDHHLQSQNSHTGDYGSLSWRDAADGGHFSFTLSVDPNAPMDLQCTYWGGEVGARTFDILIDDAKIATQTLLNNKPGELFEVIYPLPAALTQGKSSVTVKFQAAPGKMAGGLFGCRMMKHTAP